MKPIIQWLNEIEDPEVRERAVRNTEDEHMDTLTGSFELAIFASFCWSNTPEGFEYWNEVWNTYRKIDSLPPQIKS